MAADFELFSSLRYDPALLRVPSEPGMDYAGWNHINSSPLYMLDLHRDRMLRAATHWGWDAALQVLGGSAGLATLTNFIMTEIGRGPKSPLRIRVTISNSGKLGLTNSPVLETKLQNLFPERLLSPGTTTSNSSGHLPSREPEYEVTVDNATTMRSEYTHFKTTKRAMYDTARERARISLADRKEVLLINDADNSVMEGSTTTPYFWRNGRWVTPPVNVQYCPGNDSGGNDGTTRRWALKRGLAFEQAIAVDSVVDGEECWLSNGVRGFMFGRIKLQ